MLAVRLSTCFDALYRFDVIAAVDNVAAHSLFGAGGITGSKGIVDYFVLMRGGNQP